MILCLSIEISQLLNNFHGSTAITTVTTSDRPIWWLFQHFFSSIFFLEINHFYPLSTAKSIENEININGNLFSCAFEWYLANTITALSCDWKEITIVDFVAWYTHTHTNIRHKQSFPFENPFWKCTLEYRHHHRRRCRHWLLFSWA